MKNSKKMKDFSFGYDNKVLQSCILTTARYDFNVYEKRILYKLVELSQPFIFANKNEDPSNEKICVKGDKIKVRMTYKELLTLNDLNNHKRIRTALESLQHKTLQYQDSTSGWKSVSIISDIKTTSRSSDLVFNVKKEFWDIMMDFREWGMSYDAEVASSFESVYTMRLYEIICWQSWGYTIDLAALRQMLCLECKYKNPSDLINRVLGSAKRELDSKSELSFDWKANKSGRAITSVTLTPVKTRSENPKEINISEKMISPCQTNNAADN